MEESALEKLVAALYRQAANPKNLVKELKDVLDISQDSIYRRLRGDSEFTLTDLSRLAVHYNMSIDSVLFEKTSATTFQFGTLYEDREALGRYLEHISAQMNALKRANGSLIFIADELPISQSFQHSILRNFKFFYWQKVILNQSWMKDASFTENFNSGIEANNYMDSLMNSYEAIDKTEIWTEETIDDTLRQLNYCLESGLFESPEIFDSVCHSLISCLERLEKKLELPSDESKLQFYISTVELGNNIVLMDFEKFRTAYVKFNTFNTVSTNNELFCDEIEKMVKTNMSKCIDVSGKSDIIRHRFFKRLKEKVHKTMANHAQSV